MFPIPVKPSLETLSDEPLSQLYPEDFFPGGAYANLSMGRTRYWLFGPEDGPKVVLVHGITIPASVFKELAPALASKGFRVLTYDQYGRGYSEAPQTTYDTHLFITQLALLMQYVRWDTAAIVGFSMGGAVSAAFAATFPHLVNGKLALIASAGLLDPPSATGSTRPSVSNLDSSLTQMLKLQSNSLPGYDAAIASTAKDGPLRGLNSSFERIGKIPGLKVMLIHGTADDVVDYKYSLAIQRYIPNAPLITLDTAGHDLLVVQPFAEKSANALLEFLESPL